jgi:hypothetical protein
MDALIRIGSDSGRDKLRATETVWMHKRPHSKDSFIYYAFQQNSRPYVVGNATTLLLLTEIFTRAPIGHLIIAS